jgi:8-oxo-dGTP pyrophosphatase MutT (NUDIX family)
MAISEHYAQIRRKLAGSLILVPGVAAIIRDETGRVLFQKKHDGTWSLPAGAIEPGENPAQAIVRGVQEETGLKVKPEQVGSSAATVSGTNIRMETRSNTPWSCLSAPRRARSSNPITKKPNIWLTLLRRRLLLWAWPIPRRSFWLPVFRPTSSRLKDEGSPSRVNLPSIVSRSSEDVPPNALPSNGKMEHRQ